MRQLLGSLALLLVAGFCTVRADEKPTNVAHIRLTGGLDETPIGTDPLLGSTGENFKAKLDRIKQARNDRNVHALYLHLDGLSIGWGKIDELSAAIRDFRQAGKKTFAYLESGETPDYLVALACDEIYIPESGWLMLVGLRLEAMFFKGLLEKAGVKADFLQMGDFKGAAEPYTREELSPENRKQLEAILDDRFEHGLVGRIVAGRGGKELTAEQVKKLIDEGPFTPRQAVAKGLVDAALYPDELEARFKKSLKAENVKVAKDYGKAKGEELDLSNPLALLKLMSPSKPSSSRKNKIAVIYAVGIINTGKSQPGLLGGQTVGSTTLVEAIREAEEDKTVKAIVLRVDSPGGSALASDLIWNELRRCKKPVVASMGDTAASGGYYISMAAGKIYADPGTLTGSIGVVGGKFALGGAMGKVGIKTETISRGARAGLLSMTDPWSKTERESMTAMMKDVYDQFVDKAVTGREKAGKKMAREDLLKLAGGRVWTGRQAKENGLVDELGSLEDALADARKQAKLTEEPELLILPRPKSAIESLMELASGEGLGLRLIQKGPLPRELQEALRSAEGLVQLKGEPAWVIMPYRVTIR